MSQWFLFARINLFLMFDDKFSHALLSIGTIGAALNIFNNFF